MRKFKDKAGHVVYEVTAEEMKVINSPGICDFCSTKPEKGFLIAVMKEWLCPECFKRWDVCSKYYPEDAPIEKRNEQYYDRVFMGEDKRGVEQRC